MLGRQSLVCRNRVYHEKVSLAFVKLTLEPQSGKYLVLFYNKLPPSAPGLPEEWTGPM